MTPVIIAGNDAYTDQLKVWAHTFRKHNPDRPVLMFNTGDIDEEILSQYNIENRVVKALEGESPRFDATHMNGALLRLVAFQELGEEGVEKVIYMDLDILNLKPVDGLDELTPTHDAPCCGRWEYIALEESALANAAYAANRPLYWFQRSLNHTYFNAGVLVVNPLRLNEKAQEEGFEDLCDFYSGNKYRYDLADQDCLNALSPDQQFIPFEFNAMPELSIWYVGGFIDEKRLEARIRDAAVVHWVGTIKPWSDPAEGSHMHTDRRLLPMDKYFEACTEIKSELTRKFYRWVRMNHGIWKAGVDGQNEK